MKHLAFLSFVILFGIVACQTGQLGVTIDSDYYYSITVDGTPWLATQEPAFYMSGGTWYSVTAGNLKLVNTTTSSKGIDRIGNYMATTWNWMGSDGTDVATTIKVYDVESVIVFEQTFANGISSTGNGNNNDVITAFPTFSSMQTEFNYFTYNGMFNVPFVGQWDNAQYWGGAQGGPLALYDQNLTTIVISPLSNFMVGTLTQSTYLNGSFASGIQGNVETIPAGFSHSTILVGGVGITEVFEQWGQCLLDNYEKVRTTQYMDQSLLYLGYWTDNGAYYYYKTEPNTTYQETMINVNSYLNKLDVPVQYFQYDSWWYFKDSNGDGVVLWEPMPDVFPDGMLFLDNQIQKPVALHNRYWSPRNDYITNFTFVIEENFALPQSQPLFEHIMGLAKEWGMFLYEQDWLNVLYLGMDSTQNNTYRARDWLLDMGGAAATLNVSIQYCMPLPMFIMQSAEIQPVTQARASDDYNPANSQWQIGYTNLFYWSLGIFPFKDDFWTGINQTECMFPVCYEPNPELEALSAALSAGPIGPSDAIGKMNTTIVMWTCNSEGLLLKPDRPSYPFNSVFASSWDNPQIIQLWWTYSRYSGSQWSYIVGAGLTSPYTIYPSDLTTTGSFLIYDWFGHSIVPFNQSTGFAVPGPVQPFHNLTSAVGFKYYVSVPLVPGYSWALIGEVDKYITMASQRFSSFNVDSTSSWSIVIAGGAKEQVNLGLVNVNSSTISTMTCQLNGFGEATLVCPNSGSCSC